MWSPIFPVVPRHLLLRSFFFKYTFTGRPGLEWFALIQIHAKIEKKEGRGREPTRRYEVRESSSSSSGQEGGKRRRERFELDLDEMIQPRRVSEWVNKRAKLISCAWIWYINTCSFRCVVYVPFTSSLFSPYNSANLCRLGYKVRQAEVWLTSLPFLPAQSVCFDPWLVNDVKRTRWKITWLRKKMQLRCYKKKSCE